MSKPISPCFRSRVVEKSLQVLRVILYGPGLERLVAQELAPEIVQQTAVVAAEDSGLQVPGLRGHQDAVQEGDWLALSEDFPMELDPIDFGLAPSLSSGRFCAALHGSGPFQRRHSRGRHVR